MPSGIIHTTINVTLMLIFVLFIIDFFPDIDHFRRDTKNNVSLKDKLCVLGKGYFGISNHDGWARRGILHDYRIPIMILLISMIWILHLIVDKVPFK